MLKPRRLLPSGLPVSDQALEPTQKTDLSACGQLDSCSLVDSLFDGCHPELDIATSLVRDRYFDEAVRKASQRFMNRVRELADRPDLDGVGLLNKTFSEDAPLLSFSDRSTLVERDEHNGYRALAVGLAQAIRNVLSHDDNYGLTRLEALEWLAFISAMHRRLDQAEQIPQEQEGAG